MAETTERPASSRRDVHRPWLGAVIVAAVLAALLIGMVGLPTEGAPLPAVARHALLIALPQWGTTEVVSEIIYGTRGWDTFGETFLLLAAVVSVTTLARPREPRGEYVGESSAGREEQAEVDPQRGAGDEKESAARGAESAEEHGTEPLPDPDAIPLGQPAPERADAMSVVTRAAARSAAPIVAVCAFYLFAWGYTPGGGFPGGAALAGVALLVYVALGRRAVSAVVRPSVLEPVEMVGAAAIVVIGLLGLTGRGSLFANWAPLAQTQTILAGGNQQLYSGAEFVEVATGLIIAIFALLGMGHEWAPDEDADQGEQ